MHISSSYTKMLGETNFQPQEFPRSGSKAKDVKERRKSERKKERKLVITMSIYGGWKRRREENEKIMVLDTNDLFPEVTCKSTCNNLIPYNFRLQVNISKMHWTKYFKDEI